MNTIKLSPRQEQIIELVKEYQPITSEQLAEKLYVTRAALRPDLSALTMTGVLEAKPKVGYIFSKKPSYSLIHEFVRNIKVEALMSKPVVVEEDSMVYDAIVHLFLNDVGTMFVENNGALTGAVSRKDFIKMAIGGTDMHKVPVGMIMTRMPNIIYVTKEDNAYTAAQKIIEHEVDCLPVLEKVFSGSKDIYKIIGKVSKTNITKLFVAMGDNRYAEQAGK
ncbi:MAG: helix-turn-helix transcriptional regulator [Clostridiaceae bacterium]